jgi:ATP-binding cassette subfamily C (CFTR/MRP) protein 1
MLKMPTADLSESSAVALMGNDVETLAELIKSLLVEFWANALTVGIATWLLANQLGAVCIAPILVGILALLMTGALGGPMYKRQTLYQEATQDRINFTTEVLSSIKAVKMLGYTERFSTLIDQKREEDIRAGKYYRRLSVLINAIVNGNIAFAEVATFGSFAVVAKISGSASFSVTQAVTALSILTVLLMPLCDLLISIMSSFQVFGCFRRFEDFLLREEQTDNRVLDRREDSKTSLSKSPNDKAVVTEDVELESMACKKSSPHLSIVDAGFNWGENDVLEKIGISLAPSQNGSLTIVVGPIGSGKSTLLKGILGETKSSSGVVSLANADIAYCSQTPWIMNATLRDNIVAQSGAYDEEWFETVVNACNLTTDFARFPSADLTVVGDNGLKLSGGQRQRLAIARAVYSRRPMAVFDDVFSGLDKITEQIVFTRVFGENGLLRRNNTMIVLATHSVHFLPESDHIVALGLSGRIAEQGNFTDLCSRGGYVDSLDVSHAHSRSNESNTASDADDDAPKAKTAAAAAAAAAVAELEAPPTDRSIFQYYLASVGRLSLAVMLSYMVMESFFAVFRHVWLTWWGEAHGRSADDLGYWLGLYATFGVLDVMAITASIGHLFFFLGPAGGRRLHRRLLKAAMGAPMSFLSNTDTGSLINRFSQDLRLVDMVLPRSLSVFSLDVFSCAGVAGLAIAAMPWFAIAVPFIIVVLSMIQRFYVKTSKQLRILEIEHKAPLYSHFLESISGLVTIRAFAWTREYRELNQGLLDRAQKPAYLLNAIQRWLTLVLDLVVAAMTVTLVICAVTLRDKVSPALMGIALANMMRIGISMKSIVVEWSTLETSLGAVTRIRNFAQDTPSEAAPEEHFVPDESWPSQGSLELRNMSVQYDASSGPVVNDLSLTVKPGEKLGLCGRSGSGKSSIIQAILRMADMPSGQILIDGVDISTVPKYIIRQRLSCLTQDPFLFTNTVRFNADPLGEHTDKAIVGALTRVGLWSTIESKADAGSAPLDAKLDESFLSHGQRQLFCLGRALLRRSAFLILDEPTSSVDGATDARMQEVIRSEFADRTVVMIAHRLDTVLDFDRVAVLDRGVLVECGKPGELLADREGAFSRLYEADQSKAKTPVVV